MSKCRFDFPFSGPGDSLVSRIRSHVGGAGGRFDGSAESGTFSLPTPVGTFRGTYSVVGQSIVIDVTDKPMLVPCRAIESRLNAYLQDA